MGCDPCQIGCEPRIPLLGGVDGAAGRGGLRVDGGIRLYVPGVYFYKNFFWIVRDDVGISPYKSHRIKFAPWRTIIVNCQLYIVN